MWMFWMKQAGQLGAETETITIPAALNLLASRVHTELQRRNCSTVDVESRENSCIEFAAWGAKNALFRSGQWGYL